MVKARSIGTGIGAFFNNPGVILLGVLAVVLLFFQGDIRRAFGSFGESISQGIGGLGDINIQLPSIELPSFEFPSFEFPSFEFPEITFPEITFPELPSLQDLLPQLPPSLGGMGGLMQETGPIPEDFVPLTPEEQALLPGPVSIVQDEFGNVFRDGVLISGPGFMDPALAQEPSDAELFAEQPPSIVQPQPPFQFQLPQGFVGGGPSFIGGSIFQTPIANLSLSQIIDMFNVSASQAANILAIAQDNFGDFDFGTNTGLGIGSIIGSIPALSGLGGNVSDPSFAGLSAQEIADRLTGGNISNF